MLIDKNKILKAKEKLGMKNADIIKDLLLVENWDEKNKKGCCPFHNENTPSFIYNSKAFNFHCFGCSKTVDIIDAYIHTGKTYIEAVQELFKEAEIPYSFGEVGVQTAHAYVYPKPVPLNDKEKVYNYMKTRGISKETVDYADVREDEHGNCVFNYYDTNDVLTMVKYRPSHKINKAQNEPKCWCQKNADTAPLLFNMNRVNVNQPLLITEGECFLGKTEVLTPTGWVKLENYNNEDVLQINNDLTGTFVTPIAYIKHDYDGAIYQQKNKASSYECTENHNFVYVDYSGKLCKCPINEVPNLGKGFIPVVTKVQGPGIPLSKDELTHILRNNKDKTIPKEWIGQATLEQRKLIITQSVTQGKFLTQKYENAATMQAIAHTCGYSATIATKYSEKIGREYEVQVRQIKNGIRHQEPFKTYTYKGKVYCVTVPSGMILVRNDDKVFISGNCDTLSAIEAGWSNSVSIPLGSQNTHWIEHNYEWLEQFDDIIICADNDEAGVKMVKEVVPRLGSWRTKYIEIPKAVPHPTQPDKTIAIKDLNEVLYCCGKEKVMDLILNAQDTGVASVSNISEIKDVDLEDIDGVETGIQPLDKEIMRLFYGTLTVVSGKPGCVDKSTEYFNGYEWKPISEYKWGEQVLQYNPDGTASLVHPLRYIKVPCDKFYHIKTSKGVDQMVSDDHRLIYVNSKNTLKEIVVSDFLKKHYGSKVGFLGKFIPSFQYSGSGVGLSDSVIRLMCAVIADGSFRSTKNSTVRINLRKQRKKERLEWLLNECEIPYRKSNPPSKPGFSVYTFKSPIHTKKYPKEWYQFNSHQQEVFMDEVVRWDGTVAANKIAYYTTDKDNANFVQFMFSACGYRSSIIIDNRVGNRITSKDGKYIHKSVAYKVYLVQKKNQFVGITKRSKTPRQIDEIPSEDGYKYCFTVPSGMLVLRRNNTINITGNSGKTSFLSQLVCQALDQDINCMMFSRELPAFLQRSWIQSVMAGPSYTIEYENKNGAKYYKVSNEAKQLINAYYDKRWYLYNDDASNKLEDILSTMESCLRKYSTRLIILDNLMTIDVQDTAENELQKQTECITRLIEFAIKWQAAIVLVCHPRKMDADSDVGIYDIAGTSNIINLAHRTFSLRRIDKEKEKQDYDVVLTLIKDRLYGNSNKRIYMYYDVASRRFYTNEEEYNHQYKWDKSKPQPLPYPHADTTEVFGEVKDVAV